MNKGLQFLSIPISLYPISWGKFKWNKGERQTDEISIFVFHIKPIYNPSPLLISSHSSNIIFFSPYSSFARPSFSCFVFMWITPPLSLSFTLSIHMLFLLNPRLHFSVFPYLYFSIYAALSFIEVEE